MDNQLIDVTIAYVKDTLKDAEGGHDWFHISRVYTNAMLIAKEEDVDNTIVALGALLHDIADSKFHGGDEELGPRKAKAFLLSQNASKEIIHHVDGIIRNISFKGGKVERNYTSKELDVCQDADRLDAIGAVGIARAFNYGGFKNMAIYDPSIPPNLNMTKEEYKKSTAPTINHFYEKLLLLKDKMNTDMGRKLAEQRHAYMESFLEQFYAEWEGKISRGQLE